MFYRRFGVNLCTSITVNFETSIVLTGRVGNRIILPAHCHALRHALRQLGLQNVDYNHLTVVCFYLFIVMFK